MSWIIRKIGFTTSNNCDFKLKQNDKPTICKIKFIQCSRANCPIKI